MKAAVLYLVAVLVLAGCEPMVALGRRDPVTGVFQGALIRGQTPGCRAPQSFTESDLVGTWVGEVGCSKDTTLILKPDHTYLDIYQQEMGPDRYQGSGREWWRVQYREGSVPILHLTGMRFCHESRDIPCAEKRPNRGVWFDFCALTTVQFHDEVIMLITSAPDDVQVPHGIHLFYLVAEPDSITTAFRLQE